MLAPAVMFPEMFRGKDPYDIDTGWRPRRYVFAQEGTKGGPVRLSSSDVSATAMGPPWSQLASANRDIGVKGICTNTVPVCAYGSVGRFEAACLLKRLIDAAARELCMSPEAIRGVNFVPPSAMPYTSATKLLLDSGEFKEVVNRCMATAKWSRSGKQLRTRAKNQWCSEWQNEILL